MKKETIELPNGCWCSTPRISPQSAYNKSASVKKDWSIQYRFYDPTDKDDRGRVIPRQVVFKGMNQCKTVSDRRVVSKALIENELDKLSKGFNPHTEQYNVETGMIFDVDPSTPFIKALRIAFDKLNGVAGTLTDIKSVIQGVEKCAIQLGISEIPINTVTRKYINAILERCYTTNKRFTDNRYNMYRAYLMKLFKKLISMEATEINPMHDIEKRNPIKKVRRVLTKEERKLVDETLFKERYHFWRLLQVFFHSGSRETELMKVRVEYIDLAGQRCLYTVLKGGRPYEVYRPIKDVILGVWMDILKECKPGDYLFSKGLKPGPVSIRADQITRRWNKYVKSPKDKGGLAIPAGFYGLKALNTTETLNILNEQYRYSENDADEAMIQQTGHKSPVIMISNYDNNRENRQHKRLLEINNSFSGEVADGG